MNKRLLPALTVALIAATAVASMTRPGTDTMTRPSDMAGHDMSGMHDMAGYQPYTKAAFDAARGSQRVLFFHATWCPTCKGADADITRNVARLPAGVTIFKIDYDKEGALKKQYGITYQHTFVLVDAQGRALKKWAGGGLKEIIAAAVATKKM